MNVEVNLMAVLAAGVVSLVIGGLWYSKSVFGKTWMKLEGIDEKKVSEGNMVVTMGSMFVLALVMAYVLAHVAYLSSSFFTDYSFQSAAVTSAFWMWLGFVLPIVASGSLFNRDPWKLSAIHAGNWLLTLVAMGLIIGWIGL